MELDDEPNSIRNLIERLRKLGESLCSQDRLYAMVVDSTLTDRLNELSDRQIGQLLFDFCWAECHVDSPELTIVTQAIDRLRRSTGGVLTEEEAQDDPTQRPVCPQCGNEMFLHYGIDEADFWQCDYVSCQHKIYVGEQVRGGNTMQSYDNNGNLQSEINTTYTSDGRVITTTTPTTLTTPAECSSRISRCAI